jgi:hypothetical protein
MRGKKASSRIVLDDLNSQDINRTRDDKRDCATLDDNSNHGSRVGQYDLSTAISHDPSFNSSTLSNSFNAPIIESSMFNIFPAPAFDSRASVY